MASAFVNCSFAQYRASLSASLYPIRLELAGSEAAFRASFAERSVGALKFYQVHANSGFECRGTSIATANDGHYLLQLQETGGTAYTHRGQNAVCKTDSLILMDPRRTIVGAQYGPADALIVKIPDRMLCNIAPRASAYCSIPVDSSVGSANILAKMIRDFWIWNDSLTEYDHQVLPESMLRLINAVFNNTSDKEIAQQQKGQQFERLQLIIAGNLYESHLSVDFLCHRLDVSRTSLYTLTRAFGTSVERLIFDARLTAVAARLLDPVFNHLSVTEIAFSIGFQELSHFSRRFKQRFGQSPSAFRLSETVSHQ